MKILIIRLSSIGDVVLTQPIVASLRQQYPKAQIDYITKAVFTVIVEKFGCVDNIYVWDESLQILKKIRSEKYDITIDLHAKLNTMLIRLFSNSKKSVVYDKKHLLRKKIVSHKTRKDISSTVDLYYSSLEKLGLHLTKLVPKLHLESKEIFISKNANKKIGIFPGATHKTKQYPPKKIIELISMLPYEYQIYLFGSKNETNLVKEIIAGSDKELNDFSGKLDLNELCYYINSMDFIISNDSGPMHIAAALNKKQLAFFGATHPKLGFSPQNDKAIIIKSDLNCQPCSLHGDAKCPQNDFNCMEMIDNRDATKKIINSLL